MASQVDRIIPKYGVKAKGSVKAKLYRRTQQWQVLIISGQSANIMDAMIRQQVREKVLYPMAAKLGLPIEYISRMIPDTTPTVRMIDPAQFIPWNGTMQ